MLKVFFLILTSVAFAIEPVMDPQSKELLDKINDMGPFLIDAQPIEISRQQTESFCPPSNARIFSTKDTFSFKKYVGIAILRV